MTAPAYDPTLPLADSASYLGCSVKTLGRLNLEREPIPCTGTQRRKFGHRLSVLNAHREALSNPKSRKASRREN